MGYRLTLLLWIGAISALGTLGACGKEIGDSCTYDTDCSSSGERQCIDPVAGHGGYCTIRGCDYSSCPDEAACVQFFTGEFSNKACTYETEDTDAAHNDCTLDEICALDGFCVPRSSEVRYCMKTCESNGDCRDGYECRTFELMKEHGGQPLLAPGTSLTASTATKFCAVAPAE